MSITFTAEGMPLRADGEFVGEFDVNMCNRNAVLVADVLGIDLGEDGCGNMPGGEFLGRVLVALALAPADEGMPSYMQVEKGKATLIEGERPEGYLQDRLRELHALAEWAAGYDVHVWWS